MKVAFIIGKFPAMSETFILNQITGLIDRGHHVDIYADMPEDGDAHEDVAQYNLMDVTCYSPRLPEKWLFRLLKGIALIMAFGWKDPRRLLQAFNTKRYGREASSFRLLYAVVPFLGKSVQYDVLHCHFGSFGVRGLFLRDTGALSGKLVTIFHAADITEAVRAYGSHVYDRLFAAGDLFLPISHRWRKALIDLGCEPDKVIVHRMGINCREFTFNSRRLGDNGIIRFISVCRLVEKKGIEYAIRAVAKLKERKYNVEYNIIGDGRLRIDLEKLIEELDVTDKIKINGWKKKNGVIGMLAEANILLAPSITAVNGDQEGIPVALMEAMAMGLPVVSTRHSGIPELVEDGESGFLVEEQDVDALLHALEYLVAQPDSWATFGEKGRKIVEEDYNVDTLNDRLVTIYRSMLS